ncbi:HPP family protein [Desulfofustis limnaeus]|jgi:CBS-domain-containing membrane protein|uniref:Membrane protein n=1 Tax=Desulfofustis limnaeus TaxID=2740163 RepID=A0ABN6M860_9BACT|nr:HPP family protein [Desulfofustis limnaeus]MDX9895100.1 HPP family protein [Desulfofustis sp.]BDD88110.1 membrane protein [Desulfofustis limnaeus]
MKYFGKMRGNGQSPPRVSLAEIGWSWLGSFIGIAAVAMIHYQLLDQSDLLLLIGSFGASAVLIYGAVRSPLAQPRNLVGGHVLSAIIGVSAFLLFGQYPFLAAALAVSVAIALMHWTKTLHPPGGATALIAVLGGDTIHSLGYLYVLVPVAAGSLIMLAVALLINNVPKTRRYPEFWW